MSMELSQQWPHDLLQTSSSHLFQELSQKPLQDPFQITNSNDPTNILHEPSQKLLLVSTFHMLVEPF